MATPSLQSTANNEDYHHHHDHHSSSTVTNLTKLICVELDLLKESFEEAKHRIDPMIAQINQARSKFNQILQQGEMIMDLETERDLRELKQTTSKLKSKIPFNLITPEDQLDLNVNLQPPAHPLRHPCIVDEELVDNHLPIPHDLHQYLDPFESKILHCFLAFPEGAFIKASLLCHFVHAVLLAFLDSKRIVSTACELVSKGLVKSVYKKHSSTTVDGFWMDPYVHRTLKDRLHREVQQLQCHLKSGTSDGEDIIYCGSADIPSNLRFLHLGKWQSSLTRHNIEMPDPNLYLKYAGDMRSLEYISFRGVSVMKELPGFITHLWEAHMSSYQIVLKRLMILDLKACHHLKVIPSDIGNLWRSLTHLDMSECYFLDHMPASLSRLAGLSVLKGFYVGETSNGEEACTLQDLSSMEYLVKLNIYTSLETFPSENQLTVLQGFEHLRNLTICWGGYPARDENRELRRRRKSPTICRERLVTRGPGHPGVGVNRKFSFNLEKLDLRGAPEMGTRDWLKPSNFEKLEKLYIRGGKLVHLRYNNEAEKEKQSAAVKEKGWSVKVLRLRHLSKLHMDWSEVQDSFPNVVSVEKVECPNFTSFPCDNSGLWTANATHQQADGSQTHGIGSYQSGPIECEDIAG